MKLLSALTFLASLVAAHAIAAEPPRQSRSVDGLGAPAEIRVDRYGISHIYAGSVRDAFFLQGYNVAHDRLWQIDLWRKRGLGLLARDFGPAYVAKDRAARLARLLASLQALAPEPTFAAVEVVVVDNASVDNATRDAVARFPAMHYVFEPKAGLNFARNAAIGAATGDLLAYLDDDVVVDRDWLAGLAEAWRSTPQAGGFTGLVLPYRLDTEAQVLFESRGGFGRGLRRLEYRQARHGNPLHPVGAGMLGAGCNMAFDRRLLVALGGFDEALDTGAPLPGGGDLDIFYRVLRSGRPMVYVPRYAVYHEHRETIAQLRRQYWSWGLGMMAFLVKCWRSDPALRPLHRGMVGWWFMDQLAALLRAGRRLKGREVRFVLAEMWGGVMGLAGEYDRSRARIQTIRQAHR